MCYIYNLETFFILNSIFILNSTDLNRTQNWIIFNIFIILITYSEDTIILKHEYYMLYLIIRP